MGQLPVISDKAESTSDDSGVAEAESPRTLISPLQKDCMKSYSLSRNNHPEQPGWSQMKRKKKRRDEGGTHHGAKNISLFIDS
jgi:hypothetical protein